MLRSKPVSPLKKVKRKVGYDGSPEDDGDRACGAAQAQLKRLCLEEGGERDVNMAPPA